MFRSDRMRPMLAYLRELLWIARLGGGIRMKKLTGYRHLAPKLTRDTWRRSQFVCHLSCLTFRKQRGPVSLTFRKQIFSAFGTRAREAEDGFRGGKSEISCPNVVISFHTFFVLSRRICVPLTSLFLMTYDAASAADFAASSITQPILKSCLGF